MTRHGRIRKLLYDYLHGGLPPTEQERVRQHVASCAHCESELQLLRQVTATLPILVEADKERSEAFWATFPSRVEQRIRTAPAPRNTLWKALESALVARPRLAFSMAGGLALLCAAVFTWNLFSTRLADTRDNVAHMPVEPAQQTATSAELAQYLRRSKVLLVGIANMKQEEGRPVDLGIERRTSRELVQEARLLRQQPLDEYSAHLVDNLQRILIELANIEEQTDLHDVEILRGGIRKENLLFRIRMAEALYDSARYVNAKADYHGSTP